jgi:hypothetical protein
MTIPLTLLFSVMREYFASLGQSADPNSGNPDCMPSRAFKTSFSSPSESFPLLEEIILSESKCFRHEIIEAFSKHAASWDLKTLSRFSEEQAAVLIYDAMYKAICIVPPPSSTNYRGCAPSATF